LPSQTLTKVVFLFTLKQRLDIAGIMGKGKLRLIMGRRLYCLGNKADESMGSRPHVKYFVNGRSVKGKSGVTCLSLLAGEFHGAAF